MCIHVKVSKMLLDSFCIPCFRIFMFFNFFIANNLFDHFKRFSRLKQTKTEQEILKYCSVARNSKHFGSLRLLVIPEQTWEPLMPYIGFILCTIYTYVIWMKVLWTKLCVFFMKKGMGSALKVLLFYGFKVLFVRRFVLVWVKKLNFSR